MSEETEKPDVRKTLTSYKDIKKRKKPSLAKVPIALDAEKADEFNDAFAALTALKDEAESSPRSKEIASKVAEAEAELEKLREEVEEYILEFVFRSVGRAGFEEIVSECPPTKKQKDDASKRGEEEPTWNPDTFPPTLMAAAIVEPEWSQEDFFDMWDSEDWNQAELVSLFMGALGVNQQRKVVDLGKGSGQTTF